MRANSYVNLSFFSASEGAAGFDLATPRDATLKANNLIVINTEIALLPPPGCYVRVATRSSDAVAGMFVLGGVIDPDYM